MPGRRYQVPGSPWLGAVVLLAFTGFLLAVAAGGYRRDEGSTHDEAQR